MTHLQILLHSLVPQSRRENVLKYKYPFLYESILSYSDNIDIPFKQKVFNYLNNIEIIPTCKMCSNSVKLFNNRYSIYCSSACQFSDKDFLDRCLLSSRQSLLDKFGVDSVFKIVGKHDEIRTSNIQKWGVDNPAKSELVRNKISKTKKDKTIIKYKSDFNLLSIDDERVMDIFCDKCENSFKINYTTFLLRKKNNVNICINCNSLNNYKSSILEKNVLDFINQFFNDVNSNKKIKKYEVDIFIPELKLGFEFNGLYWHSEIYKEMRYHLDKTKECSENGIRLFHIWEDDWLYKQDIVKSMILNKIGKTPNKIFARKCQVKEITDNKLIRDFLNKNHIQGFVGSKIKLGLFYQDELVSLMTFGNLRKSLGQKSQEGSYEMLRFCNKLKTNVVGGASKLFKYFLRNHDVKEVISYSDSSRSDGSLYNQLGFNLVRETDPNYYWIINGVRKHRFNFRKDRLVKEGSDPNKTEIEIMNESGFYRIFDCGSKKWSFSL